MLDRSRPYSEVYGMNGAKRFEQDGRTYRPDGSEDVPGAPVVTVEAPPVPPAPVVEKRGPGRPRKSLNASTALAHQFAGYGEEAEWFLPAAPVRDVLAPFRDPIAADGGMVIAPSVWVDGV